MARGNESHVCVSGEERRRVTVWAGKRGGGVSGEERRGVTRVSGEDEGKGSQGMSRHRLDGAMVSRPP